MRFSDNQILSILKQAESGFPVVEIFREYGMSSATIHLAVPKNKQWKMRRSLDRKSSNDNRMPLTESL